MRNIKYNPNYKYRQRSSKGMKSQGIPSVKVINFKYELKITFQQGGQRHLIKVYTEISIIKEDDDHSERSMI